MISHRTIISGYVGRIFAIFSLNESILGKDNRSGPFFRYLKGCCHGNQFCEKNGKLPTFNALTFRNRIGYHYLNEHINSKNDAPVSCKNFVNFGPVTPELTKLICERLVQHGQKTGVFSRISPDILDRFSQSFHHMKALWVQMMYLCLIFQFVKGHCQLATSNVG